MKNLNLSGHPAYLPTFGLHGFARTPGFQLVFFVACCLLITIVGVVDIWLVLKYPDSIFELEQNPICLLLIEQDPYHFTVFTHGKLIGLTLVISGLVVLFRFWNRIAMLVTSSVTLFQLWLLGYLYLFSDFSHLWRVYID